MYKKQRANESSIGRNASFVGETIENKIRRIVNNKEPISDNAPITYTERKKGVEPEYNIRTDRWEVANEAMDKVTKAHQAKRENRQKLGEQAKEGMKKRRRKKYRWNRASKRH